MTMRDWVWIAVAVSLILGVVTSTLESWSKLGATYMRTVLRHQWSVLLTVSPLFLYLCICFFSDEWSKFLLSETIWLSALSLFVKAPHALSCGFGVQPSMPVNQHRVALMSAANLTGVLITLSVAVLVYIYEPKSVAIIVGGVVALLLAAFLYYVLGSIVNLHRAGYVSRVRSGP